MVRTHNWHRTGTSKAEFKQQIAELKKEIRRLKKLLRYAYKLPMNIAGGYDENIAWGKRVEQALKGQKC